MDRILAHCRPCNVDINKDAGLIQVQGATFVSGDIGTDLGVCALASALLFGAISLVRLPPSSNPRLRPR